MPPSPSHPHSLSSFLANCNRLAHELWAKTRSAHSAAPAAQRFGPSDRPAAKSILYVEDDFFLGDIYQIKFSEHGYGGVYVQDGVTAWETAQSEHFDLVLTGIIMPRLDGLELLKLLKSDQRTRSIPVIIISNLGEDFVVKGAMDMGAADYILMSDVTPRWVIERLDMFFHDLESSAS